MINDRRNYFSFVLRMWRADGDKSGAWRATAQNAQTGDISHYADLDSLFAYLRKLTTGSADEQPSDDD